MRNEIASMLKKSSYISVTDLAIQFNTSARALNRVLESLKWIEKKDKWLIVTKLGVKEGGIQKYNAKSKQKYIVWNSNVKNNKNLINALNSVNSNIKESSLASKATKKVTKKIKGDKYEEHVANFFKTDGYYVWEHGKEKGAKDGGIDLFIKKGKCCYFVQCKDWENWKISDKIVKATQKDVRNYMIANPVLTKLLADSTKKILYVTSKECLTKGAYTYIKKNEHILEYQVISIDEN